VTKDQRRKTNDEGPSTDDLQSQSVVGRRSLVLSEDSLRNRGVEGSIVGISLLVLAFVALAAVYSVVTPLGEGPDEPGHARYVFFLARAWRLPVQRAESGLSDVPGEGHQPPLAYALMAPLVAWLPADQRQFDLPGNTRFTWAGGDELNAVAHGSREYMPWRGFVLAWHLARLVSVALGAATVVLTYLAAKALTDQRPKTKDQGADQLLVLRRSSFVPLLAAGFVAFNPQFLFVSALITNDALLVTLSAALLWLVVRSTRRPSGGVAPRSLLELRHASLSAVVIGVLLGLALLTKQSALILTPVALLSVLQSGKGIGYEPRESKGMLRLSRGQLVTLSSCVAFVVTTALVCGWWYARNWRLYGDLFGLGAFQAEFMTQQFEVGSWTAWRGALAQLHASFWARFGWMNVPPSAWVIWLCAAIEAVVLAGWLKYAHERPKTKDQGSFFRPSSFVFGPEGWWPILALPVLAFGWVVSFALTAGLVAWQGRLLFPALPALAILLARGLVAWDGKTRGKADKATSRQASMFLLPLLLVSTLAALALWLPFGVIRPAYVFHTLPEATALDRLGTQVYGRYGVPGESGAELRGWRIERGSLPGGTLELTLIWHALARQNRNWTVFVHVVDAQDQIVAEDNRQPQGGAFPMSQWVVGDWVEDRHPLVLPAALAPGQYRIRVGLFDPRTERRAGMYNQRGRLRGDYLDVGSVSYPG
jgi:hypothetical protein